VVHMGLTRAEETTQNKHCRCVISAKILECKKVPFFAGSASPSEQKSESAGCVVNVLRTWIMEFLSRSRMDLCRQMLQFSVDCFCTCFVASDLY